MIERNLLQQLQDWKNRSNRKPLIIRGARQVGKTTLVKEFGKGFPHFINLNLELSKNRQFFEQSDDIHLLVQFLFLDKGISLGSDGILIFIDEVQESPKAIQSLRYFKEEYPQLFVIAAGSLLEHALSKVKSFPVGRVEYLNLHPVNFEEFLSIENPRAFEILQTLPIPEFAHPTLLNLFHQYAIVGGLPEVLSDYIESKDFTRLIPVYESLVQSYKDDIKKYAHNKTEERILRHIIDTAPFEADNRIKFQNFGSSNYRSREVGEAMRTLELTGLIQLMYPTTMVQIPALPDKKKSPRLQLLDTGLMNYQAGYQKNLIGIKDLHDIYKGRVIQHLVVQQFISTHNAPSFKPLFWVREKRNAQAEIDLVCPFQSLLIPIEVKAGKVGKLRSLHQFMETSGHHYAVRFYAGGFSVGKVKTPKGKAFYLLNLPYYLSTRLNEYLEWFYKNYPM